MASSINHVDYEWRQIILNRIVTLTASGLTYEADPRHCDLLKGSLNLTESNASGNPGVKPSEREGIVIGKDRIPVLDEYLSKIQDCFATSGISPNCDLTQTVTYIQNNKHNQITSTYYLLLKKKQRETGRDHFFE